jgi:hypothetical protein
MADPGFARLVRYWAADRFSYDGDVPVRTRSVLQHQVLAKAPVDECFEGIGLPYPPLTDGQCLQGGLEKRNQAYVWGLTRSDDWIFWGTVANVPCTALSNFMPAGMQLGGLQMLNGYYVCEGEDASSGTGDWRMPRVYRLNALTRQLEDLSDGPASAMLVKTGGLRSAGALGGVAFVGGPALGGGINLFAFDGESGTLLAARHFPEFSDIRSWVVVRGALYTGVGVGSVTDASQPGGFVLRWRGDKADPMAFEVVGSLPSEAAYLVEHQGRIYLDTWPVTNSADPTNLRPAGVFRSPPVPPEGLTAADAGLWQQIWSVAQYDPDLRLGAATTGGGGMVSHDGYLYWGTMHVPMVATLAALMLAQKGALDLDADRDGSLGALELFTTMLGTHRSTSLFRLEPSEDGAQPPVVRLVYGETFLPVYDPQTHRYAIGYDDAHRNRMGQVPLWGASGFGNWFNQYVWAAKDFQGKAFLGSFDAAQLDRALATGALAKRFEPAFDTRIYQALIRRFGPRIPQDGADLFYIADASGRAWADSLDGLGHDTNYGIRTLLVVEDYLLLGMANPMNLDPTGGWELIGATAKPPRLYPHSMCPRLTVTPQ